ncbi:6-carboxytetrahydropterin synthase [Aminobacter phage Erebus]|nr:6-carboxytetrahydropterin synthase [Aminobacter phage Erebus]
MTYRSTKTYGHEIGLSCAFRQWRAKSHCRFIHGYALAVRVEFEADTLDERNWVIDFGDLKAFKQILEDTFDHKLVVATDDPEVETLHFLHINGLAQVMYLDAVGCEAFAEYIFKRAEAWLATTGESWRVRVASVEVKEHGANSAIFTGSVA